MPEELFEEVEADIEEETVEERDPRDLSWIDPDILFYGRIIRRRLHKDSDLVVAITGDEGDGKSTLGIQLCMAIDKGFELGTHMMFSPSMEETKQKIKDLPRYSAVNADEAIKMLYKLKWNTKMQIYLNMLYAVCRQDNKASVLLMPRFIDFNEFFRNHRIKIWIHVIARGLAIIFRKDKSAFAKDPWWFDECQKIIDAGRVRKKIVEIPDNIWLDLYGRTKIYVGVLHFGDLPDDIKKAYREEKGKHELIGLDDDFETKAEKRWKGYLQNFIGNLYYAEKVNPGELRAFCKKSGLTNHAFYEMLNKYAEENQKPEPRSIMKKRMMKRVNINNLISNPIEEESGE